MHQREPRPTPLLLIRGLSQELLRRRPMLCLQPPPPLSPVESMEVRIDFEVGRVTLPVSKLANVATGSVIEMPGVALDRVVAKSGGHAFAFGEFVELGGRVGFRILKLAEPKEKC